MANMTNIVDFNSSDGLPPWVVQKLNHNFWGVVQKIIDDQVVMVSGVTAPSPRTEETLWYNTETGDLYIWREFDGTWGWDKIDIGYIHVDPDIPSAAAVREDDPYIRKNEFLWITTNPNLTYDTNLFIWSVLPGSTTATWHSLGEIIAAISEVSVLAISKNDWLASENFYRTVKTIIDDPTGWPYI